VSEENS